MYQEIIENEPDNPETVREFSLKSGTALKRIEQLIQSILKITRIDAGSICFEKSSPLSVINILIIAGVRSHDIVIFPPASVWSSAFLTILPMASPVHSISQ